MVTYLVVLLQFQISIPTDIRSINSNSTMDDGNLMNDMESEEIDVMTTLLTTTLATTTTSTAAPPVRARKG